MSFGMGRKGGQPLLRKCIAGRQIRKFESYMQRHGVFSVIILKLNPLTSLDIWNYLAGASAISFMEFTIANMIGITPLIAISSMLGEGTYTLAPQILGILILLSILYAVWFLVTLPKKIKGGAGKN